MKKKLITAGIICSIVLIALTGYYFYSIFTRNIIQLLISQKRMINILIAGSNVYHNNKHKFYGILSINPENNKIGLTFLPPSMRIDLNGKGKDFQKLEDIDMGDFKDLSSALDRDLKIKIPFYIELYSPDIVRVVDLLEGIDLLVLDQVKGSNLFTFGPSYLDGNKVIKYINYAEKNSIYRKYDRIQDVLLSLYYKKERYKKFNNLEFITEAIKSIKTNLLPQEIMSLLKLFLEESELVCTVIPGELDTQGFYYMDNIAYKIYEKEFLTRLVYTEKANPNIKVKILNGTDIPGLARKMRNLLIRDGLNLVEFGTSPYPKFGYTFIINQKGNIANVRKVSEIIGVEKIYHIIDNTQMHDVLIITGKDFAK